MTIKNISSQTIFRYAVIFILLLNLPALFYLYKFAEKYVYNTIYINNDSSFLEIKNRTENLKVNDFEAIIQSIKQKNAPINREETVSTE